MNKITEISEWIEKHSTEIIKNIDQESVDVYNFLKKEFKESNVNENYLFQFVFRSFYRIDNAGLTPEFKKEYFEILEENRNEKQFDFEKVLRRLYSFPNRKGQKTLQFSFATKMFNTIDDIMPIYDSEVAKMFSMTRPYQSEFEIKLDKYLDQLEKIQNGYELIIKQNLIPETIGLFDEIFTDNKLSEMKKMDFIFWSAGKIKTRLTKKGDDGFHTIEELDEIDQKIKTNAQHSGYE
ncbi:hypothetical protein [Maribacter dokdonensis]|uniref:hypothetical protein n=1 Tax=Maribacter dokdonensis TaxID=320912 RepID=UPI001C0A1F16|nr:hypothetical protein [Maribacter dokdonensis]MBU2901146.1 hypothetical protein [Maribacter dokdonensis]